VPFSQKFAQKKCPLTEPSFAREEKAELGARLGTYDAMAAQVEDAVCQRTALLRLELIQRGVWPPALPAP